MSRTRRNKLTGAKAVSKQCRNNGECPYCYDNRMHSTKKRLLRYDSNGETE